MKTKSALFLLCLAVIYSGCNKNGFEGDVRIFNTDKGVSGIKIQATTSTDIKEEQAKATRYDSTDQTGHYSIRGLLPNRKYLITSVDPRFASGSISEIAPVKGTRIIDTPLSVCPMPQSNGIWFYDTDDGSFNQIDREDAPKLRPRIHPSLLPGIWSRNPAYSISENDSLKLSASIPNHGLIIIKGKVCEIISRLYKISQMNIRNRNIEAGWYFNISAFHIDTFGDLVPTAHELDLGRKFNTGDLVAIPVANLDNGLYFFTTRYAVIKRSSWQGNLNQPQEGYLIRVGGAQTQEVTGSTESPQEGLSLRAEAARAIKEARDAYVQASSLMSSIHDGPEADLNAIRADLDGLKNFIESCRNLFNNGKFVDTIDRARAITYKAKSISRQLQDIIGHSGGKPMTDTASVLARKIRLIESLNSQRDIPTSILAEASRCLPEDSRLTELGYSDNTILIKGMAKDKAAAVQYAERLAESPFFKDVHLLSATNSGGDNLTFNFFISASFEEKGVAGVEKSNVNTEAPAETSLREADLDAMTARLKDLEQIIPVKKEIAYILRQIQQLAYDSRLDILRFAPGNENKKDFYAEWPISIHVSGNYNNLGNFFDRLSNYPRVFIVRRFIIRAMSPQTDQSTISADITLSTCLFYERTISSVTYKQSQLANNFTPHVMHIFDREDPFLDSTVRRGNQTNSFGGPFQYSVEDEELTIVAIVKNGDVYTARIGKPKEIPALAKIGDKFADGYILSISETQVVFRKTHERGIPLMRPKDIVKEIKK
jgi:Tfp pilus assembly protein PilO